MIEPERREDERGFFARVWCADELESRGLQPSWVQSSVSYNVKAGTLRGMHYQAEPHGETKLVTCTAGAVWDVIIDLRQGVPTFRRSFGVELTADNFRTLYVPRGFAHGFLTLKDHTVVQYHMAERFEESAARGVRWDDSAFDIKWPASPALISERDRSFPDFEGSV